MICTDLTQMLNSFTTFDYDKTMRTLYKQTKPSVRSTLQTIEPNYTSLFFSPSMGEKREVKVEKFKKGDVFALQGVECDDFLMPIKEYEVIKRVDEIFGVQLDGLVVKQISGDVSTIFSLTKTDCQTLGVEFQPRLLFFPLNMNWKEVIVKQREKISEFNPLDMSTYPVFKETKLIERIVVKIDGITQVEGEIRCNGFKINRKELMGGFMLSVKKPIQVKNGMLVPNQVIYGTNVTAPIFEKIGLLINDNSIYFEFNVDGIDPLTVEGVDFHDLFDVKVMGIPIVKNKYEEIDVKVAKAIENAMKHHKDVAVFNPYTSTLNLRNDVVNKYQDSYGRKRHINDYRWEWERDTWESDECGFLF